MSDAFTINVSRNITDNSESINYDRQNDAIIGSVTY
jgi:hypothetical protein